MKKCYISCNKCDLLDCQLFRLPRRTAISDDTIRSWNSEKALYNDVRISASLFLASLKEICDRNVRRVVGGSARASVFRQLFLMSSRVRKEECIAASQTNRMNFSVCKTATIRFIGFRKKWLIQDSSLNQDVSGWVTHLFIYLILQTALYPYHVGVLARIH